MVPAPHLLYFISINIAPRRKEVIGRWSENIWAVCLEAIFFKRDSDKVEHAQRKEVRSCFPWRRH